MVYTLCVFIVLLVASVFHFWRENKKLNQYIKDDKYLAMLNGIPQSLFLLDKNKIIIGLYNVTAAALGGYRIEDIVGKHLSVFSQDPQSPFYQACSLLDDSFDRVFSSGVTERFEYTLLGSNLEARITKIAGDRILSQVQDVSNIVCKNNEFHRKAKNEIYVALTAGGLSSWSMNAETMIFSSQDKNNEFISQDIHLNDLVSKFHPDDRDVFYTNFIEKVIQKKEHTEFIVRVLGPSSVCPEAGMKWWVMHAVPHEFSSDESVIKIIGSQKNITEDYEQRGELIRLREQAEESSQIKTAFLANMSHEIRTPLNAIVGFSSLMSSDLSKAEKEEFQHLIDLNNNLLLSIIGDILDLSKIESGKLDFTFSEFNVYDLLSQLSQRIKGKAKPQVKVDIDPICDKELHMICDDNRLSQVLANFLDNAAKFTAEGSICYGFQKTDAGIRFYVTDTGAGIAPENQTKVFERFFKLDDYVPGTGLGLSICQTIVNNLGGQIGVNSTVGEGSTFWCVLPERPMNVLRHELQCVYEERRKLDFAAEVYTN